MQVMQNDNYHVQAELLRPMLLKHIQRDRLDANESSLLQLVEGWNLRADKDEKGPTVFNEWWREMNRTVWIDDITRPDSLPVAIPQTFTLMEALLKDSAFVFIDDKNTPEKETLPDVITIAFRKAAASLKEAKLGWADYKATGVRHLINSLTPFSRLNLPIGGGSGIINATTGNWGPSWRVVVHLTDETEAWGVYPGGQNGNPGSKYYDQFVDQWVKGEYNKLWVMKPVDADKSKASWKMTFKPGKA
jgi:penicillin amidase